MNLEKEFRELAENWTGARPKNPKTFLVKMNEIIAGLGEDVPQPPPQPRRCGTKLR